MGTLSFALAIDPDCEFSELLDRVRTAERLGFDTVYVPDHARSWRRDPQPGDLWFDGWTVLAAAASATTTVRLGTLVTNPIIRPPGLLAREALAVDHLSSGRLQVGIGTGIAGFDHAATGTPYWSMKERVARFTEYVALVDALLRAGAENGGRHVHDGTYYPGEHAGLPAPVQRPRPPITVAGASARVRSVAVERAQCWNTHGAFNVAPADLVEHLTELNVDVSERCNQAGRDPASLQRSVLLFQSLDPWAAPGRLAELAERMTAIGYEELCVFWPWDDEQRAVFERDATELASLR